MGCAVADIGKTTMRLTVLDRGGSVLFSRKTSTPAPLDGAYRSLDLVSIEAWLLSALHDAAKASSVDDIIITTHGAAAVLLDRDGSVKAPAMDYEFDVAPMVPGYEVDRPPFTETGAPSLPMGLNLGRQLAHQSDLIDKHTTVLPLPQYFAFRLSGIQACEVSSLGCHTDLWCPAENSWSSMAEREGWAACFAPMQQANSILGPITEEVQDRTGLPRTCQVRCGAHDSNAALVPFLEDQTTVLSTGTWFIAMAPGGDVGSLDSARDCLVGADVYGRPVPTARFMGGREFALAAGPQAPAPSLDDIQRVMRNKQFIVPSLTDSGGPFPNQKGRFVGSPGSAEDRAAMALLYISMMAHTCLSLLPQTDRLVIEGPAASSLFCEMIAALRPQMSVERATDGGGATNGAARLVLPDMSPIATEEVAPFAAIDALETYHDQWLGRISA